MVLIRSPISRFSLRQTNGTIAHALIGRSIEQRTSSVTLNGVRIEFVTSSFAVCSCPSYKRSSKECAASFLQLNPGKNIEAVAGDEGVSVASDSGKLGAKVVSRRIAGETYHFSAAGFFQINHDLLEPIIKEAIGDAAGELAVDLYCGVGLFTLPLARRFKKVVGIEANRTATDFARQNLKSANITNALIETARVGDWMQANSSSLGPVDLLLLDPPRTGAENKDMHGILELRPSQISYVSCDPATLARDLKKLIAAGYKLHSIKAFDMFPQTHHVETVVRLKINN